MKNYVTLFEKCKNVSIDKVFKHLKEFYQNVPELLIPYFENFVIERLENNEPLSRNDIYFQEIRKCPFGSLRIYFFLVYLQEEALITSMDERYLNRMLVSCSYDI